MKISLYPWLTADNGLQVQDDYHSGVHGLKTPSRTGTIPILWLLFTFVSLRVPIGLKEWKLLLKSNFSIKQGR